MIRQAFWPRGLRAICMTPLHFRHIAAARTQAVRALGVQKSGAHPGIRLSLLTSAPEADPGCYSNFFVHTWTFVGFSLSNRRCFPCGRIMKLKILRLFLGLSLSFRSRVS